MKPSPSLAFLLSHLLGVTSALRPDAYYDKRGLSPDSLYARDIDHDGGSLYQRSADAEADAYASPYPEDGSDDFSQLTARDILDAAIAEIRARDLPLDAASLYGRAATGGASASHGGAAGGAGAGGAGGASELGGMGGAGGAEGMGGAGGGLAGSEMGGAGADSMMGGGGAGGADPMGGAGGLGGAKFGHFAGGAHGKKHKHKHGHGKSKLGMMGAGSMKAGGMHDAMAGGAGGAGGGMPSLGGGMARRDAEAMAMAEAEAEADPYGWDMMEEGY